MTRVELYGVTAEFEDIDDVELDPVYRKMNEIAFDRMLPSALSVRWARIKAPTMEISRISGWLYEDGFSGRRFIFLDERLRPLLVAFPYLVELVLLHEMTHLKAKGHGPVFLRELLTALEKLDWEPLVGKCSPSALRQVFTTDQIDRTSALVVVPKDDAPTLNNTTKSAPSDVSSFRHGASIA